MLGRYSGDEIWSKFVQELWYDKRSYFGKQNSTLGSVVPLAMFNFYMMWENFYLILLNFWICMWCEWICIWWEHLEFCFFIPPPLDRSCPKHRSRLNIHQEDKTIRRRQVKKYLIFSPKVIEYIANWPNLTYCNISKGLKGIFKQRKLCVWWILLNGELKRKQSWRQKTFSEARRSLKISGIWQSPRIKWKLDFVI